MEPSQLPNARLRQGLAWNAGSVFATHLINFARYAVVARLLPVEAFGQYAMVNVAMLATFMLSNWGWRSAFITQTAAGEDPQRRQDSLWTADLLVRIGTVSLLALAAPLLARAFGDAALAPMIIVSGGFVLGPGLRHPALMNRERELDFRQIAMIDLSGAIAGLIVAIAGAFLLGSAWALVLGQSASAFVPAALSHVVVRAPLRGLRFDPALIRQGYRFSRNLLALSALGWVTMQADNAMVGVALGASALGLYATAYRLCEIPKLVQDTVVTRTVLPYYAKALQHDTRQLGAAWTLTGRYSLWLIWFAYLPMLLAPELVLHILFGEKWLAAAPVLRVLALAGVVRCCNAFLSPVFIALQRPAVELRLKLAETVIFVAVAAWGAFVAGRIELVAAAGIAAWGLLLALRLALACLATQFRLGELPRIWAAPLAALGAVALATPLLLALPQWAGLALLLALLAALFVGLERERLRGLRSAF